MPCDIDMIAGASSRHIPALGFVSPLELMHCASDRGVRSLWSGCRAINGGSELANERFYLSAAAGVAAAMLFAAVLPWPYGYYRFLRLVVTAAGILSLYAAHRLERQRLALGLFGLVLAFNPLFPLGLEREQWAILNVVGGLTFAYVWNENRRGRL